MKTLHYSYFREYFDQQMDRKIRELQRFSFKKKITLQDIAQELGYKSPSSLSMIATGQRLPSKKILNQLFNYWNTSKSDRKALESLVEIESRLKKGKQVLQSIAELKKNHSQIELSRIPIDQLELIKEWYYLVVFEALNQPSLPDHETLTLYKLFDRKISIAQINRALELFLKNGLIEKLENQSGARVYRKLKETISTSEDVPSEAIRSHHKGMIQQAMTAIDDQPVEFRQYSGLTFRVSQEQLPELKGEIQQFFSQIYEKYGAQNGEEIYQMNLQLFSHLNPKLKKKEVNRDEL